MGSAGEDSMYDYIIVGSGPAGMQMGYFMTKHGVNHIILEGGPECSMFTRRYPRHRNLISINKPYNYFKEDDYNMRHDWNSLLCDDKDLLFRKYTEELFPNADKLVDYLDDFKNKYKLNIKCNQKVEKVAKLGKIEDEGFRVTCANGEVYTCKRLIMATGAMTENKPSIPGIEHATTYGEHSLDQEEYKNKRVCIVGAKNSAFETGDWLAGHAAVIHFHTHGEIKMAWDTHFVGDLRAVNNNLVDMYHLKSLHAMRTNVDITEIKPITEPDGTEAYQITFSWRLPHWRVPGTGIFKTNYDKIIYCTGWKYVDQKMYEDNIVPESWLNGRLPILKENWESTVPHLYFMGTSMQARDKKSASGFIHGFRYNCRTLYHILQNRYSNVELPLESFENVTLDKMSDFIVTRTSTTSALYQMNHGFLCDIMTFDENNQGGYDAKYYYEIPSAWVYQQKRFMEHKHMWVITLGDNRKSFSNGLNPTEFAGIPDLTVASNKCWAFTEPVIKVYSNGQLKEVLNIGSNLVVRHDKIHQYGVNPRRAYNMIENMSTRQLPRFEGAEEKDERYFGEEFWTDRFTPWTKEEIEEYAAKKEMENPNVSCSFKLFGKVN